MIRTEFVPSHGVAIQKNIVQEVNHLEMDARKWAMYMDGPAFTGSTESDIYVCAGILPIWKGRWYAWAAISDKTGRREMLWIHRNTLDFLDNLQSREPEAYRRIETTARVDHPDAQRWLELLSFEREGRLRCYDATGLDHIQYSRTPCH